MTDLTDLAARVDEGSATTVERVIAACRRVQPHRHDPPIALLTTMLLEWRLIGVDIERELPIVKHPRFGWQVAEWLI